MINDVHGNLLKSSENGYRRCMKYFGDLMDLEDVRKVRLLPAGENNRMFVIEEWSYCET